MSTVTDTKVLEGDDTNGKIFKYGRLSQNINKSVINIHNIGV